MPDPRQSTHLAAGAPASPRIGASGTNDPTIALIRSDDIPALRAALKAARAARKAARAARKAARAARRAERPAIIARAIELRERRWSLSRIGAELGVASMTIRNWLARAGRDDLLGLGHVSIAKGPERKPHPRSSTRHLPTIIVLREQRATLRAIGQALGISAERVRQILKRADRPGLIGSGVAIRKQQERRAKRVAHVCEGCGTAFSAFPYQRRRFCSIRCSARYHARRQSPETRAKISAAQKARWARRRAAKAG